MVSVIYLTLAVFIVVWLALKVIRLRREHRISMGDGDILPLRAAIRAHANALEYLPLSLLLLIALEFNGAPLLMIHVAGMLLIAGRIMHARAMLNQRLQGRVLGMQITLLVWIGLAVLNLVYLPYDKLISLV